MASAVRIGTCSWADETLSKIWYPKGLPAGERLAWYAEHYSTVEVDSTFYRVPDRTMVQRWADRTPDDFVMHIKAFGVMTRHPVRIEQVPPHLRDGMPVDERGRVDRPPPELRAAIFGEFWRALEPLRETGKLGGILFQLPPYLEWKPAVLDYLEWAQSMMRGDRMLVEFRNRSFFEEGVRDEMLRFLEGRGMSYVTVDAPRLAAKNVPLTVVAATSPLAYVRFHGRNAATWNARGGSAAKRFDYTYSEDELREWVEPLRELSSQANETYAFFNNNNQPDGVAQAPAGANLLMKLLEDDGVAVG